MIEEEMKRYRPTKNYLEHLQTPNVHQFESEVMKNELERIQNGLPMDVLSMRRYELPPPPAGKLTDIAAWQEAVDNSCAQLEHQALRITNLELLNGYGGYEWRRCLEALSKAVANVQNDIAVVKKKLQELNWQRKNEQLEAGDVLSRLEESWVTLVGKNFEIERICCQLERELVAHKKATDSENTENQAEGEATSANGDHQ